MKRICQAGRSMMEMLGVLAVIGVLSIGGLAMYRQSIRSYQVSQTIDFIQKVKLAYLENCQFTDKCGFCMASTTQCFQTNRRTLCTAGSEDACVNSTAESVEFSKIPGAKWYVSGDKQTLVISFFNINEDICSELLKRESEIDEAKIRISNNGTLERVENCDDGAAILNLFYYDPNFG